MNQKISHFTDLHAWKKSHKIVLETYKATKTFPDDEKFGLVSKMRRACISVTSNIAEGFGRRSPREKVRFYTMAHASLTELQNQFITSKDLWFFSKE
ncbi:four helix bundle protein [Patescibacteria group bacterium]